jgi:hypothetical protein
MTPRQKKAEMCLNWKAIDARKKAKSLHAKLQNASLEVLITISLQERSFDCIVLPRYYSLLQGPFLPL